MSVAASISRWPVWLKLAVIAYAVKAVWDLMRGRSVFAALAWPLEWLPRANPPADAPVKMYAGIQLNDPNNRYST